MRIKKGDTVKVMAGKEKGKIGKILRVDQGKNLVWVEKTNFVKRHQKPNQQFKQGGIVEKEAAIHASNVMYYDEKSAKHTRLGVKIVKGEKVRISRRSGAEIGAK
ncbi:MAG TPA: 50S ribosomal protein L24 [bacterium]|jgi:large subunit ribosomal protein L24|nr:50S ribosomal protein L24 [Myxococcales bacterium]OQA58623.1 MAG: 50S ribosomal protein L24 [bacterium ADurb.Bin270]HPW45369.1 50S ribosomal protein L24 [bacterium]HQG13166.1 50S ribosomal protein L24 [bacterium]HQH80203.1 50S ribosomal protein L24 [bacterium]